MAIAAKDEAMLIVELQQLLRLTHAEATVARIRQLQAGDKDLRDELEDNRKEALQRAERLSEVLRTHGGVAGVISPTLGKLNALVKTQLEASINPSSALLSDLLLEHDLLERVRFVRAVAERLQVEDVVSLMEDLSAAHTETVEWIRARLDELAAGETPRLRPLPPQQLVGAFQAGAVLPISRAAKAIRSRSGS
jgi:bacterioferritin (cytochrome b1)